jgi:SPP1 family predicted phage head-tail adaptor
MSYGKLAQQFIEILSAEPIKDSEGFTTTGDTVLANVRAYKEDRHGNEKWANMAAFSNATALFRFRKIPGLTVDTAHVILCGGTRYKIVSVEDVKNRGMYIEVLCESQERTVR